MNNVLPTKIDWTKVQVKAKSLNGEFVVGYLNRHRGDCIVDVYGDSITSGDFYVFVWHEKVDSGVYGVNYAIQQDSIEIAPADECI